MLNTDSFIKRLEKLLDYYQISASAFADRVGVQRSSLSHLLSGRNKPSLDLIMKITEEFKEVNLDWIINGKGNFPKTDEQKQIPQLPKEQFKNSEIKIETSSTSQNDLFSNEVTNTNQIIKERENENANSNNPSELINQNEPIDYFVIFYKDGTFKKYISK